MTTDKKTQKPFRVFCFDQVMRLSGLPGRPFTDAQLTAVANDFVNTLERLSGGDRSKVRAVIDDAVDFERFPSRVDLQGAWNRKYPPMRHEACHLCRDHVGFIVETKRDSAGVEYSAARKCGCGAVPSLEARFPEPDGPREAGMTGAAALAGKVAL